MIGTIYPFFYPLCFRPPPSSPCGLFLSNGRTWKKNKTHANCVLWMFWQYVAFVCASAISDSWSSCASSSLPGTVSEEVIFHKMRFSSSPPYSSVLSCVTVSVKNEMEKEMYSQGVATGIYTSVYSCLHFTMHTCHCVHYRRYLSEHVFTLNVLHWICICCHAFVLTWHQTLRECGPCPSPESFQRRFAGDWRDLFLTLDF